MTRTMVFLCRCGGSLDRILDWSVLEHGIAGAEGVVCTAVCDTLCLADDIRRVAASARAAGAGRILAGVCSVLGRAEILRRGLAREGWDPRDVVLADLREGCAWIHGDDPRDATRKASVLLRMGLARCRAGGKSPDRRIRVTDAAAVIGAGPAGLSAAVQLARAGVNVHLIERGAAPGGMLNLLDRVYPTGRSARERIAPLVEEATGNRRIFLHLRGAVRGIRGYAGDFKIRLVAGGAERTIRAGAVILATGARALLPENLYRYGELPNVVSQIELEKRFRQGPVSGKDAVFIQCVGVRGQERPYCSAICCPSSLKNAGRLAEQGLRVFVLHRDIMTPGHVLEAYYRQAMDRGVRFVRFDERRPPEVRGGTTAESVAVYDAAMGGHLVLPADLVVLSTALVPAPDHARFAAMLDIPLDRQGFFDEAYPLHPVETIVDGVFVCGSARWPASSDDACLQGEAAAMKARVLLAAGDISCLAAVRLPGGKPGLARVDEASCTGCGICASVCPFAACRLQDLGGRQVSRVNRMRCQGCGNCASVCPNGTIQVPEMSGRVQVAMIRQAFPRDLFPARPAMPAGERRP